MVHILGNSGIVIGIDGCRYWAERGLIHCEDTSGGYKTLAVRDVATRIRGLSDMARAMRAGRGPQYLDERERLVRFIEEMTSLCKKAQEQGMPSDPSAVRDLVRRQPTVVRVPKIVYAKF